MATQEVDICLGDHFVSSYIDARNTTYIGYKPMVNEPAFGSADLRATLRGVDMHLKALGEVVHLHGDSRSRYLSRRHFVSADPNACSLPVIWHISFI